MASPPLRRRCDDCPREAVCDLTAGNSHMWPFEPPHLALCGEHFNARLRQLSQPGVTLFFRWRDCRSDEEPMPWRLLYPLLPEGRPRREGAGGSEL